MNAKQTKRQEMQSAFNWMKIQIDMSQIHMHGL